MTADRPPIPFELPPDSGFEWAVRAASGWERVRPGNARPCRAGAGAGRPACGRPSVARLMRARRRYVEPMDLDGRPVWWHYCERHLYGHWLERGQVVSWRAVPA